MGFFVESESGNEIVEFKAATQIAWLDETSAELLDKLDDMTRVDRMVRAKGCSRCNL